jgi:16S rRNA (guanine(966)-N(2))-methyltransferase RsmD
MKVTGGIAKGRKLRTPPGKSLRLTTDRVKGALFNLLPDPEGRVFLELFAGTGNVSIEALSRGARRAVLVEKDGKLVDLISENLTACGLGQRAGVISAPVETILPFLAGKEDLFDIVFADPPYEQGLAGKTLSLPGLEALLAPGALVVVEHSFREDMGDRYGSLVLRNRKKYGDTVLSIYGMEKDEQR